MPMAGGWLDNRWARTRAEAYEAEHGGGGADGSYGPSGMTRITGLHFHVSNELDLEPRGKVGAARQEGGRRK